eukprot:scaffold257331_cov27-Tisochrysis_lutea.AAC.2
MATPRPNASESIRMKEFRRVRFEQAIFMPETKTIVKSCSTMPPTTQMGIEVKRPPTLPKMPNMMSQKAHEKPAEREAQRGVGWRGEEAGDERVQTVGEEPALYARVDVRALLIHRELRRDVRHANVADSLGGRDEEADEDGQEVLDSKAEREGLDPQEGDRFSIGDVVAREVVVLLAWGGIREATDARLFRLSAARRLVARLGDAVRDAGEEAAEGEAPEEEGGLEEGRAEELDQRGHHDDREGEANILGAEEACSHLRLAILAAEDAAAEVFGARRDETATDEHHGGARHHRREDALERLGWDHRNADLKQCADHACAKEAAIAFLAVADAVAAVAEASGLGEGEGGAHHRDEASAEVVLGADDARAEDLHNGEQSRCDPSSRDHVLFGGAHLRIELPCEAGVARNEKSARGGDARDHRERVLEAHQEGEEERQPLVLTEEEGGLDAALTPGHSAHQVGRGT